MKFINLCSNPRYRNVETTLKKLLKFIPNEHLVGVGEISLVDDIKNNDSEIYLGMYYPKYGSKKARIEISPENIFRNRPTLFFIPMIGKYALARILFHEVGHHYKKTLTHNISDKVEEDFVEDYSKKYCRVPSETGSCSFPLLCRLSGFSGI